MNTVTLKIPQVYLNKSKSDPFNIILEDIGATEQNGMIHLQCESVNALVILDFENLSPIVAGSWLQALLLASSNHKSNHYFSRLKHALEAPLNVSVFDLVRLFMGSELCSDTYKPIDIAEIELKDSKIQNMAMFRLSHPSNEFEVLNKLDVAVQHMRA